MDRYICIHGHFYQPPRENPWLEEVEVQNSAHPFHDWNERISAECYAPNTASRILGPQRRIIDLLNNYGKISYNFGPTLLSWMERNDPEIYRAVIDADRQSRERFSGHGSAIAQCYNHMILPLATSRDKRTQIIWGIADFEARFGRNPEGMWLAETAVDLESLDIMAEMGIRFTILAPSQARRIRKLGEKEWQDVDGGRIDPRRAYICGLPSGRSIALFFYDGPIARDVAFAGLLNNGQDFANRLLGVFSESDEPQLVHIATDGETYGHHHRFGDMALAYCLYHFESTDQATITIYGEFLDKCPPTHEAEIIENSSWSCVHGLERWRADCGCCSGGNPDWHQKWREPLRAALDWLRDNLVLLFETQTVGLLKDPWAARDNFIRVVLDRSDSSVEAFLAEHASGPLQDEQKVTVLKLLEMQRNAMLMYTSCGWFFDEITGIETVQVIAYAARAMQLAADTSSLSLEETFRKLLQRAPSNIPAYGDGGYAYDHFVEPSALDLVRVGAHFAVSSLFEEYAETANIYCYKVRSLLYKREDLGKLRFAAGRVEVRSEITWERRIITFTVIYFGDHNLAGGVREFSDEAAFDAMYGEVHAAFRKSDVAGVIGLIQEHFGTGSYSLRHLFRDEQRKILDQILDSTLSEVEGSLRQIKGHHYPILDVMRQLSMPLPRLFARIAEMVHDTDLMKILSQENLDIDELRQAVEEASRWSLEPDRPTLGFLAGKRMNEMTERWRSAPEQASELQRAVAFTEALDPLHVSLDLWRSQNAYFTIGKDLLHSMKKRADEGEPGATSWLDSFAKLGVYLGVRIE